MQAWLGRVLRVRTPSTEGNLLQGSAQEEGEQGSPRQSGQGQSDAGPVAHGDALGGCRVGRPGHSYHSCSTSNAAEQPSQTPPPAGTLSFNCGISGEVRLKSGGLRGYDLAAPTLNSVLDLARSSRPLRAAEHEQK